MSDLWRSLIGFHIFRKLWIRGPGFSLCDPRWLQNETGTGSTEGERRTVHCLQALILMPLDNTGGFSKRRGATGWWIRLEMALERLAPLISFRDPGPAVFPGFLSFFHSLSRSSTLPLNLTLVEVSLLSLALFLCLCLSYLHLVAFAHSSHALFLNK